MKGFLVGAAMAAAACLGAARAEAFGGFPSEQELMMSSWNSTYLTVDGRQINALVKLRGRDGTYDTPYGQGRLMNIQYGVDTQSQPGNPFFQITGEWSFQGQRGTFLFASRGAHEFSGSWNGPRGGGKWTGSSMFGQWEYDPNRERWYCEYRYPAQNRPTVINTQIVMWYPSDAQRTGYYYFVNKKNETWGRCVCPSNPDYDPRVMQWSTLSGQSWTELNPGDCPAPKDGDQTLSAIDAIPDPPA